ncbi:polymorphic toxin-type HINT domain-containing protein [Allokutzneria sp. A3M-2-11 16]|uniref:RHS repeat-associated core domain-containing protein n=1 Tax=Allokutzneria sp. A3M-2-11 16 TaxID=2962043 RepID=UPI0020B6BE65|nr:RHS repeat-associated core domain-containing protein [Allokutzneria sp. A3M-2-11 16]MCP3805475.1 polymorphic toxin-type HINT domain-containing protein [Allokutzneria sp. A3M-2-11 16]
MIRGLRVLAAAVAASLVVSGVALTPQALSAPNRVVELQKERVVPGTPVPAQPLPGNELQPLLNRKAPVPAWPAAAKAEVDLGAQAPGAQLRQAGRTPVSVGRPESARARQQNGGKVQVETFDQKQAVAAGVSGTLLRVSGVDGPLSVRLDYKAFENALGGAYGSRLGFHLLPECALTTPEKAECRKSTPVRTDNNATKRTLTAEVPSGAVLAAAAAGSGSGGTYEATPLSPAGSWSAGGSSGDFSYSYPFRLPPAPGAKGPAVSLGYSSGSIDGRTSSTNNQASVAGDGWELAAGGSIERRYKGCAQDLGGNQGQTKTGDLCWATDNATLSLGGTTSELVKVSDTVWRPKRDDGSRVEKIFGGANGDDNGEHWKVTTTDGTQYFLGMNRLPGWAEGKPETRSTWSVPVYGNNGNEPCNKAAFADSWCNQAWRWNLDYVVDPKGNVTTYYYEPEINHYGRNAKPADATAYTRGGFLTRIEYGLRSDAVYGAAPNQVRFDYTERCVPTPTFRCEPGQLNKDTAKSWPDVPFDRLCASGEQCTNRLAPSFFSRKRLTKVVTEIRRDNTGDALKWHAVDSWSLRQFFPATTDGLDPALWLAGITRTGHVGGEASVPELVFHGVSMSNRVDANEGLAPIERPRLRRIINEAGGYTEIGYAEPECKRDGKMPPNAEHNTMRCYPMFWTPEHAPEPILDWFHKYVVRVVVEGDRTGASALKKMHYEYHEGAAWHFDENEFAEMKHRTYSSWRGYRWVRTWAGEPGKTLTLTDTRYMRGMDGDPLPGGGKREAWVPDTDGGKLRDHERLQGFVRETVQHDKGKIVSGSINEPKVQGPTATNGDKQAFLLNTESVRGKTLLEKGKFRRTQVSTEFNEQGIATKVDDAGDIDVAGDEKCTRTTYARNEGAWMLNYASQVRTVALPCAKGDGTNADIVSDVRSLYDNKAFGTPPTRGEVTTAQRWTKDGYQDVARTKYDAYGRAVEAVDAANAKVTTAFVPASGFAARTVTTTNPRGHVSVNTVEPAWAQPVTEVGPNKERVDIDYDPLGRTARVWGPGRSKEAKQTPSREFAYTYAPDKPVVVATKVLREDNTYATSYALYDGLMRLRQNQTPTVAGGRLITDSIYDDRGLVAKANGAYYNDENPKPELLGVLDNNLPNQTITEYDEMGRATKAVYRKLGVEQWATSTVYGGDRTHLVPPAGDTPTTVVTNAQGQVTERHQYQGRTTTGPADVTKYGYDRFGRLEVITDAAGSQWRYEYDELGRKRKDIDRDKGTTTYTYDALDQVKTTTDARSQTLTYEYDDLRRKTAMYEGSTKLAEWTFDTLKKGLPTSSTRFVNGHAYTESVTAYDAQNRPEARQVVIPPAEGKLAGTYVFGTKYTPNTGLVRSNDLPAAGGLAAEEVKYEHNELGQLTKTHGLSVYGQEHMYTKYGETLKVFLGEGDQLIERINFYEEGTRRLETEMGNRLSGDMWRIYERTYSYDPAGNITKLTDKGEKRATDTQCFRYDHLRRLTKAFTPSTSDCAPDPAVSTLGGPAPYWVDFSYDKLGNRKTETKHTAQGDTTRTYEYPKVGEPQPHTLRAVTQKGPTGESRDEFGYNANGETTTRKIAGDAQKLDWNSEGRLAKVTHANGQTSEYVYGADGSRLLKREPKSTVLYLGGTELVLEKDLDVVRGKRYYNHGSDTVAMRTSWGGLTLLTDDHQGTGKEAFAKNSQPVTQRYHDPFGNLRGGTGTWPDDKGFVGGTQDSTGLTHLGAREYDPGTGRFLSVDPVMDLADPQQTNGYSYANNSPITMSDPDGLQPMQMCIDDRCEHVVIPTPGGGHIERMPDGSRYHHKKNGRSERISGPTRDISDHVAAALAREGASRAEYERARALAASKKGWWDVVLDHAGDIVGDLIGINDVKSCFTGGDLFACFGLIPWGRLFKVIGSAGRIAAAISAANRWIDEVAAARATLRRLDSIVENARRNEPPCNSFVPGTLVLMANGSRKPIEEVKLGDQVLSTDPVTGETGARAVVATIIGSGTKQLVELTVGSGPAISTVTATAGHPFWNAKTSQWEDAGQLVPGDALLTPSKEFVPVTAVRSASEYRQVFNLTVEGMHTYYVFTGEMPLLNHNCERPGMDFTDAGREKVYEANRAKNGGVLKCEYCGREVVRRPSTPGVPGRPDDAQIDHIEPKSRGGHGGDHNGAVACRNCNRSKSNKTLEEWDDELRDFLAA